MNTSSRHYSLTDRLLLLVDQSVRTLTNHYPAARRRNPSATASETATPLSAKQQCRSAGLMRVNHVGEICAQALYLGQSLTARTPQARIVMQQAAAEENDHLVWCHERLQELNSHVSYLNPFWYSYSFWLGLLAGLAGDAWSLGFIVETERQVIEHLTRHLQDLPREDQKSRSIVMQMCDDESHHATTATMAGAKELPALIKRGMKGLSKVMTKTAYWL